MKIKKGDTVLITKGKDKRNTGKVLRALPRQGRVLVEGMNLKKKHVRAKRSGEKGEMVSVPGLIPASSVRLICPKCKKATRIGYKELQKPGARGLKIRICKKCGQEI